MAYNLDKLLTNKIRKVDRLKIQHQDGNRIAVMHRGDSGSLTQVTDRLMTIPGGPLQLYVDDSTLNPITMTPVRDMKGKVALVGEILKEPGRHKFVRVSEFVAKDGHYVVSSLGRYDARVRPYALERKKNILQRYQYLRMAYSKVLDGYRQTDDKAAPVLLIAPHEHGKPLNSFVEMILHGIRKDFDGISKFFTGFRVLLVDPSKGLYLLPGLADKKQALVTIAAVARFMKLSEIEKPAVENEDAEPTVGMDAKAADAILDAAIASDVEKAPAVSLDPEEVPPETAASSEPLPDPDVAGESSVDRVSELDLDEILSTDVDQEYEKLAKENEEFLAKYASLQEKAVGALADSPRKLDLIEEKIVEPSILSDKMKRSTTDALTRSYYRNLYQRDLARIAKSLNRDPDSPVSVTSFEIIPSTDTMTMKDELRIGFVDKKGKKHSFVVDVPKLSHDGFLFINGNKKFISKQATLLPVIKEAPDRVQITTNYRKTFIYRKGDKSNSKVDRLYKVLVGKKYPSVKQVFGNAYASNFSDPTSLTMNFFAKKLMEVRFSNSKGSADGLRVIFSLKSARYEFQQAGFQAPEGTLPVGMRILKGKPSAFLVEDVTTREIRQILPNGKVDGSWRNLADFLESSVTNHWDKQVQADYESSSSGKVFAYSQIKIAAISIPLGVLLSFYLGLTGALDLAGIKYEVDTKRRRAREGELAVQFSDATVLINPEGNAAKELIANGLYYLDTKEYSFKDAGKRGAVYVEYFGAATGSRNTGKALLNFESSMIDPITEEILEDLVLPTDFPGLLLYGNNLLENFAHKRKNDLSNFRIRDSEVLSVGVYTTLMKAFNDYKRSSKTGIVTPISVPKDSVVKAVMAMPNVEDYSVLSPFLELETKAKTTFKGPSGLNSDDSYTEDIRAFDKSMLGVFGVFTPVSSLVGVRRSLTLNPIISNSRGFLSPKKVEDMTQDELYAPGELLNNFTANRADPMRIELQVLIKPF